LYRSIQAPSACDLWYRLPTDVEWNTLKQTLWCSPGDVNLMWQYCEWLWWKNRVNSWATISDNIVELLQLPLSWYKAAHTNIYNQRGQQTVLWSSVSNGANTKYTVSVWAWNSFISSWNGDNEWGYSVRCIKD